MASRRVLVADDNVSLADTVGEILGDHGFDVTVVSSGAQALIAWRERPADVAVLDVDLPDIGGLRIARRLSQRRHRCGLVIMSAGDPEILVPRCDELGAGFLPKPFSPTRLLDTIDESFERRAEALAEIATHLRLLGPPVPKALLEYFRRRR
jgi:two-component system response regulator RegX3